MRFLAYETLPLEVYKQVLQKVDHSVFFVPNFSRQMDLLKRQFISGQAKHLGGDKFLVMVKDFEAEVVVKDGTFVTINLGG